MNYARSRTVCGPILAASRRFRVGLAPDSPSLLAASLFRGGGVVIFRRNPFDMLALVRVSLADGVRFPP